MCELQGNRVSIVQLQCRVVIPATDKKLFEKLSEDAKSKMNVAVSTLVDVNNDLANGNIKISLLNEILEKKEAYLDLLKIGNYRCRRQIELSADGLRIIGVFVNPRCRLFQREGTRQEQCQDEKAARMAS